MKEKEQKQGLGRTSTHTAQFSLNVWTHETASRFSTNRRKGWKLGRKIKF